MLPACRSVVLLSCRHGYEITVRSFYLVGGLHIAVKTAHMACTYMQLRLPRICTYIMTGKF